MKKIIIIFGLTLVLMAGWLAATKLIPNQSVKQKNNTAFNCTGTEEQNYDCYERYYETLIDQTGVAAAFFDLRERYKTSGYIQSQCHPLTHTIGRKAVQIYPDISTAFSHGDSFCWSGYYHGALEGVVGKIGRKNIDRDINNICAGIPGKENYSFDYYNCVHGLGHGVMAIFNDELFESLKMCDSLTGQWERQSCWSGVFMENVIVDNLNHKTQYLKPADPLYPCNAVSEQYKSTCYLMQTSYMLKVSNENFRTVFALCRQAGEAYIDICHQSLGRDASGRSVSDVAKTRATCLLGQDFREQSNCLIGAVKDFISYYHSDKEARVLCAGLPQEFNEVCLKTAIDYYKVF